MLSVRQCVPQTVKKIGSYIVGNYASTVSGNNLKNIQQNAYLYQFSML